MTTRCSGEAGAPDPADTPIGELVDGLAGIGAQPIAYARLPRRAHTVYAPAFARWSDLAEETVRSLTARPGGGPVTVRALLAAARDAVARARSTQAAETGDAATAVRRLLDRLTERDRMILSARSWARQPATADHVARVLGVSAATVFRSQPACEARFAELLADPLHRDVLAHADQLRARLGPVVAERTVKAVLGDLGLDPSSPAGLMLLDVAGPYRWREGWLENTSAGGLRRAAAALDAAFTRPGAQSSAALVAALGRIGMAATDAADFVSTRPGLRRFGDTWVRWGTSAADQAEAVLRVLGAPAAADVITAAIGEHSPSRPVREALYREPRFVRATRQTWALREWGLDQYTGVFGEIAKRIDAAGGTVDVRAVLADVAATFPDVAEISIRTYLNAVPGFVTENGMVRRRTPDDDWPAVPAPQSVRGVFFNGRNEIRVALPVTRDVLRGSGQPIRPALATALGVTPGGQRLFAGPHGQLKLAWQLSSTHGPCLGSLRALAAGVGANRDDTLVLAFDLRHAAVAAASIPLDAEPSRRLQTLLGRRAGDPIAALARALRCPPEQVAAILRKRRDDEILALVERCG